MKPLPEHKPTTQKRNGSRYRDDTSYCDIDTCFDDAPKGIDTSVDARLRGVDQHAFHFCAGTRLSFSSSDLLEHQI